MLLTASLEALIARLTARTTNPFGKDPRQVAKVLDDRREFEPRLRRNATVIVDTTAPLEECVRTILDLVES